ncbi:EGF domain-specific O-linked N-acetylglucosamine transferase [Spatholobus suberectus]|nr:EGF domain-specific O-linked N-acetylglucosamine transferase [Spatholobus suberectus]
MLSISEWAPDWNASGSVAITCNCSHLEFDICTISAPTLLDHASSTLFALGPNTQDKSHVPVKIHPYPLKSDKTAMSYVKEVTLTLAPPKLACGVTHHTPALLFSAGGYTGNFYHEINENFIPLFITINSLFPNQDVTLAITDGMIWWFQKYAELLSAFSPHHLIINTNNLSTTHCFPSTTIGLIKHGPMIIDPKLLPYPKTLLDFRAFLDKAYAKVDAPLLNPNESGKPRLTLMSRTGNVSRVILNQKDVIKVAKEIGFNVHVLEPSRNTSMANVYRLIHASHVLLGVHGAGLTNFLFLKPGSVLVQVVPIGLDWASKTYYEKPPKFLGVDYIEYKIQPNESSLLESYGANSLVIKDPVAFQEGKWSKKRIYWKKQDVKIDIIRFRKYLTKAYEKAKIFMS